MKNQTWVVVWYHNGLSAMPQLVMVVRMSGKSTCNVSGSDRDSGEFSGSSSIVSKGGCGSESGSENSIVSGGSSINDRGSSSGVAVIVVFISIM